MNERQDIEDRVTQLEELYTHQQHLVEELNGVMIELRTELSALTRHFSEQQQRLISMFESQRDLPDPRDERPPHY